MDEKFINEKLSEIKDLTTSRLSEVELEQKALGDKIDGALEKFSKSELGDEFKKELNGRIDEEMSKYVELQKQVDALDESLKKNKVEGKDFKSSLKEELEENTSFKNYLSGNSTKASFEVKAHLVTGTNASGDTIAAQRIPGVKYDPSRLVRMRDIIPIGGSTTSNKIRFVQENSFTNNAATKAEASAFGESEFKLVPVDANVETLGTHITLSKEMFDDLNVASSYIAVRVPQKVLDVEDTQILTGDGSSPNIQGIAASGGGSAYAADADASADSGFRNFFLPANYGFDASGSVNEYDVVATALYQLEKNNFTPSAIVVHPFQWYALALRKGTDLTYIREGIVQVMGVPVIKTTAQTLGSFLVADFNVAAQLFYRSGIGIEMSDSNNDDFEKLMVTVRAYQRFAMPIYLSNAAVYGTFAAATTALQ